MSKPTSPASQVGEQRRKRNAEELGLDASATWDQTLEAARSENNRIVVQTCQEYQRHAAHPTKVT